MQLIANINQQLTSGSLNDSTTVTLEDQRDQSVSQLAKLMDIRVTHGTNNQITISTSSGAQLVGTKAALLSFNQTGTLHPDQQWNSDPTKSGLGTVTLTDPSGGTTDLIATGAIQSGEIAGYLNMRDKVLVQAQSQIDQIAAQMSSALSDTTTAGTASPPGPQTGFSVDIGNVSNGNNIQVTYKDAGGVERNLTIIRVDDPAALPLPNSATSNPNDTVIGIDFSGTTAQVAARLNAALGPTTGLNFSNPAGTALNILNNNPATISVDAASTTTTATSLTGGSAALPLFVDGTIPFTGTFTGAGAEATGYAGRITVNDSLFSDPSKLITYQASTPAGDTTRPNFIYNQLVNVPLQYSPAAGIGSANAPMQASVANYISQIVSQQSIAANAATNLQSGQDVVVNALQSRFNSTSGVNIDTEMANLLTLQNSYGANARVMSTVKAMLDALLQI